MIENQIQWLGSLRDFYVIRVTLAPDAGRLLVSLAPQKFAAPFQTDQVLIRLAARTGQMRSELARVINRKHTPDLMFQIVMPEEFLAPLDEAEAPDGDDDA